MLVTVGRDLIECDTQGREIVKAHTHIVDVCSKPLSLVAEMLKVFAGFTNKGQIRMLYTQIKFQELVQWSRSDIILTLVKPGQDQSKVGKVE